MCIVDIIHVDIRLGQVVVLETICFSSIYKETLGINFKERNLKKNVKTIFVNLHPIHSQGSQMLNAIDQGTEGL